MSRAFRQVRSSSHTRVRNKRMIHFQKGKSLESQLKILLYHAGQIICTNFKNYDWLKNFEQPIIMLQTNKAEKYTKGYWIWACLCF